MYIYRLRIRKILKLLSKERHKKGSILREEIESTHEIDAQQKVTPKIRTLSFYALEMFLFLPLETALDYNK